MSEGWTRADSLRRTWRSQSRRVIRQVLAVCRDKTPTEISEALRAAYPFGQRDAEPIAYRIWQAEIRRQLSANPGTEPAPETPSALALFDDTEAQP